MQLAGTSNFEWLRRCPQICATFVLRQTGRDAFARFGGDPADLEVRDPSQAAALWSWDNNFKPVLRIGGRDGWTVIVEEFSAEGARPEVLRSVSAGTRAFSVLLSGSGMVWFSHATSGRIDCAFEPSGASQQRRSQVIDLAAVADVSVEALMTSDGRVPDTTLHWAAVICGFPLDDALFGSLASSGLVRRLRQPFARFVQSTGHVRRDAQVPRRLGLAARVAQRLVQLGRTLNQRQFSRILDGRGVGVGACAEEPRVQDPPMGQRAVYLHRVQVAFGVGQHAGIAAEHGPFIQRPGRVRCDPRRPSPPPSWHRRRAPDQQCTGPARKMWTATNA